MGKSCPDSLRPGQALHHDVVMPYRIWRTTCRYLQSRLSVAIQCGQGLCTLVVYGGLLSLLQGFSIPVCVSIGVAYGVTLAASTLVPRAHGRFCRLATVVAAGLTTGFLTSIPTGVMVGFVTACLPRPLLWWPPKGDQAMPTTKSESQK